MTMTDRDKLIHAVTDYDRKQRNKAGYNPNALGQYFLAVDEAIAVSKRNKPLQEALADYFNDRLLDVCLKAIN